MVGRPEKSLQTAAIKFFVRAGCRVYAAGTRRKRPPQGVELRSAADKRAWFATRQTPGLPDLPLVFLPMGWYSQRGAGRIPLLVVEFKQDKTSRLSPDQLEVQALCFARGIPHAVFYDMQQVIDWGLKVGLCGMRGIALHFPYSAEDRNAPGS